MLNKGLHILRAIQLLDQILQHMKDYQHKKAALLPALDVPTREEKALEVYAS